MSRNCTLLTNLKININYYILEGGFPMENYQKYLYYQSANLFLTTFYAFTLQMSPSSDTTQRRLLCILIRSLGEWTSKDDVWGNTFKNKWLNLLVSIFTRIWWKRKYTNWMPCNVYTMFPLINSFFKWILLNFMRIND